MYLWCTLLPLYGSFLNMFSRVFLIFSYWNFDIRMFVLRSSISVQVSKKKLEIINKREGVQISIRVLENNQKLSVGKKNQKLSWGKGVFFMEKLEFVNLLYHWSFTIPSGFLIISGEYIHPFLSLFSWILSLVTPFLISRWTLFQNSNLLKLLWKGMV